MAMICDACGAEITGPGYGAVWRDGVTATYCHDDDRDCYTVASWEGFPELG